MNAKRILLTGCNGQVGWELQRTLPHLGELASLERRELDLNSDEQIRKAVRRIRPDMIVNAAAYTNVNGAETDRAAADAVNGRAPGVLGEELRSTTNGLLLHYSTDYVFDGAAQVPYREDERPAPLNMYGASKLAGEQSIARSGVRFLILRSSWVYGARGSNFARTILRLARESKPLRIVEDQVGAPTWCGEIAEATARVVERVLRDGVAAPSGIYHMTAAGQTSWYGFAAAILEDYGERLRRAGKPAEWCEQARSGLSPIKTSDFPSPAVRPRYSVLDNSLFRRTFGFALSNWREQLHRAAAGFNLDSY